MNDQHTDSTPAALPIPGGVEVDNVGLAILTTIRNYGVDTVFGIPGTHNLEFYRHVPTLGFRAVTTRHEQGAGYGADGWSLQTGQPGVVITTSGPGMLNSLSAAATSYCESRPMIVLSPGVALGAEFADVGTLHETKDTRAAAAAIVEWSRRVENATEAVQAVHDAFELFRTGRPRPVYIEVPLDVLEGPSDVPNEALEARPVPEAPALDTDAIAEIVRVLEGAERPVMLAGGGSRAAGDAVAALAERWDAPVITTLNGKGVVSELHPLSTGSSLRLQAGHDLVNAADVLLIVGAKVGEAELWLGPLEPSGTVVRLDLLDSQLQKNVKADHGLVGSSAQLVPALTAALSQGARDGASRAAAARTDIDRQVDEWSPALSRLAREVASALPDNAIVGADSSQVCYLGTANAIPLTQPNSYLYMAAYATLGYGLPASIGAKIAAPDRTVVAVIGDGALMFSVQELITAVEQGIDLVVVCVDNGGYGEIEQNERDRGIAPIGVRLAQPDWAALATAFGGNGVRVESADDLAPRVRDAIAAGGLQLLHVPTALFTDPAASAAHDNEGVSE